MNSDEILPLLKSSLRIAGDEDNEMLKLIIDASIDNVKSMVGEKDEFFKENKSFKLAVLQQSTIFSTEQVHLMLIYLILSMVCKAQYFI